MRGTRAKILRKVAKLIAKEGKATEAEVYKKLKKNYRG